MRKFRKYPSNYVKAASYQPIAYRWDGTKYVPYEIPFRYNCVTYSPDTDEIVNCISCFKTLPYGETYCSHQYHDRNGFGFAECEECYNAYMPEYIKQKKAGVI